MFSHTLGRRTLKCYLMLAAVHVDTAGFLRRASESMHNNFAIYCGPVMVPCRCYIGFGMYHSIFELAHSVGCGPLRPLAHSWLLQWSAMIGSKLPDQAAFLTQEIFEVIVSTFLHCNILYKEIWLTERTFYFTTVLLQLVFNKLPYWDFHGFKLNS